MNKIILIFVLFFTQNIFAFESCKNVRLVSETEYAADKIKWDSLIKKCKDDNIQVVADFSLFSTNVKESPLQNLTGALSTIDLLNEVGNRTVKHIENNVKSLDVAEKCLSSKTVNQSDLDLMEKGLTCPQLFEGMKLRFKEKMPELRHELSFLGQMNIGDMDYALTKLDSSKLLDPSLNRSGGLIGGGVLHADLAKQSKEEIEKTKKEFDQVLLGIKKSFEEAKKSKITEILSKMGLKPADKSYKSLYEMHARDEDKNYLSYGRSKLQEFQKKKEMSYMNVAGSSPFLLYIGSENPSNDDFLKTIPKLRKSALEELGRSKEALASASVSLEKMKKFTRGNNKQKAIDDLMYFFGNTPVIEEVLSENNKNCATAMGLKNFIQKESQANQLMIMGGLFGGAYLFATRAPAILTLMTGMSWSPTAAGAIFGISSGVVFEQQAWKKLSIAKDKFNSGVGDLASYQSANDEFVIQTVLHPLDFMGAGALLGRSVKAVEIAAMKRAGLSERAVADLVKLSESKDSLISFKARKEIAKYSWRDLLGKKPSDEELRLFDLLFKQKVVDQDLKNSKVSETLKAILSLKEEEKQFLTKLAQSKPTGARGLAQLLTAISKENDREAAFLSSLNQSGIKGLKAQAMCFCAKVCTKKVTNSSEFNLICSL